MPEAARPDLSGSRRVHVIGAGGTGMSAIAAVLASIGHQVSGSDAAESATLADLAARGVRTVVGHDPALAAGAEVVVRSTAVPDDDPEVRAARRAGVVVWRRADVLAAICALRRTAAVAGTHGKTTTSSMLAVALRALGWHPSMIVGGNIAGIGSGAGWDRAGEWFVVEADESDGTFLELGAEAAIVTSVEADHLDYYGGLDRLEAAFARFVTETTGPVAVCTDDPGAARLASVAIAAARAGRGSPPVMTYGSGEEAQVRIEEVALGRHGSSYTLRLPDGRSATATLEVPGLHNVRNATGVVALALGLGAAWPEVLGAIGAFRGVGRRFEGRGEEAGISFVDGYDHLPTEIAAAVATARAGGWDRVVVVFQPHRYSRTEALWRDFGGAFAGADVVVVTGIYAAGEAPRAGVTGRLVYDAVGAADPTVERHYVEDLDAAAGLLRSLLRPGDVCLTLGAGDITTLPDALMAAFREGPER